MELSLDWMLAIGGALALAGVCKLVSKSINKKVDTMFDDMADTRTQRFFFAFDGQPEPITVTQAAQLIEDNNGKLEIEGLYNDRQIKVTVMTRGFTGKADEDSVAGHCYSMPCVTSLNFLAKKHEGEDLDSVDNSWAELEQPPVILDGLKILTNDLDTCTKFLKKSDVGEYISHLINSSKVKEILVLDNQVTLRDTEPKGGESFIRIKAILEMQDHLARTLEGVTG